MNTLKQNQSIWRAKRRVRRYVSIASQMLGSPAFASFTYKTPQHDVEQAIQDWREFTRRFRIAFPAAALIRVPERHKSGAVHFHAAIFGLPPSLPCVFVRRGGWWKHACAASTPCERKIRALAAAWGKGFVDLQQTRQPEKIGAYIAKYLTKNDPDWSMFGHHIATCNQAMRSTIAAARRKGIYFEMTSYNSPVAVDMTIEDLSSRSHLRLAREFETLWLGKARHEIFDIDTEGEKL